MLQPKIEDRKAFRILGTTARINPMTADYGDLWSNGFDPRRAEIEPFSTDGCFYGVYYETDEPGMDDFMAAMAVTGIDEAPEGLCLREIPPGREAIFETTLGAIGPTWRAIFEEWLPASGFAHDCSSAGYEVYPPGEMNADTPVAIHLPIRPENGP